MAEQTIKTHACACPTACKFIVPILMIVFGVSALIRELTEKAPKQQEV